MKIIVLVFFFLVFAFKAYSEVQTGKFTNDFYFSYDISKYAVLYYFVPEDYNANEKYSLIIAWYGCGLTPDGYRDLLAEVIAEKKKVIIVAPVIANQETMQDYVDFNNEFFKYIYTNYSIDTNKTIITGFSWGGQLAFELALTNPDSYSGIIGLAPATHRGNWNETMWSNIHKTSMAVILGDKDANYPYVDSLMQDLKARGTNLLYLLKPDMEHIDEDYYSSQEFALDFINCYDFIIGAVDLDEKIINEIIISPNPFSDYIAIENSDNNYNYEIYDMLGNKIQSGIVDDNSLRINIINSPDGIYFLKIFYKQKYHFVKLVKY